MRAASSVTAILVLLVAVAILQASATPDIISGTWHWETDGGERQITMTFKAEAGKLTGIVSLGQVVLKSDSGPGEGGGPSHTNIQKGSVNLKIGKGKVDGNHFMFLLEEPSFHQQNRPMTFTGDVEGDEIHAFESVLYGGKELHRIAFTLTRVQNK